MLMWRLVLRLVELVLHPVMEWLSLVLSRVGWACVPRAVFPEWERVGLLRLVLVLSVPQWVLVVQGLGLWVLLQDWWWESVPVDVVGCPVEGLG